jgi:ribosome-binding protein aMBF1 (putative translation factor)
MTSKKKNTINEPSEVYETTSKVETTSEELHPVLVKLLEKSIQDAKDGKGISHEEAMKRIKEKIASLK